MYIVAIKVNGAFYVASPRRFRTHSEAELYTAALPASREPIIVRIG